MSRSIKIRPEQLGRALDEMLVEYRGSVVEGVNEKSKAAVKRIVAITRQTAPVRKGSFRARIASKLSRHDRNGDTYAWYVRDPEYRKAHLLEFGHRARDGGTVRGFGFLASAVDQILPQYERDVEEVLKNGK